jgi:hypothetical protein
VRQPRENPSTTASAVHIPMLDRERPLVRQARKNPSTAPSQASQGRERTVVTPTVKPADVFEQPTFTFHMHDTDPSMNPKLPEIAWESLMPIGQPTNPLHPALSEPSDSDIRPRPAPLTPLTPIKPSPKAQPGAVPRPAQPTPPSGSSTRQCGCNTPAAALW